MKVLRYSAIAAVAIFAAACGDKVTVAGPTAVTLTSTTTTTTTPVVPGKINSIAVAPAAVTLTIGQAVTLVAAVNADPGVALTVTWSSSDATKASVSTAGLVTALAATPGVAICATSTVNVGVKGCASAVVVAASATVPATVSIAGVYGSSTTSPINPASVTGSVSAMVNVDPGTETISKVYLKIGSVVADSQVFSAAQSAALRNAVETANETGAQAAGENMADASSSILLTFNSAAYNGTTGAVSYANGAAALSVQLFVAGNTAARSTATYSTNLTLNNTDAVYGYWTLPSTAVTAADVQGYTWTSFGGGAATLNTVGVFYSGKTAASYTTKYTNFSKSLASAWCDVTSANVACVTKPTGWDTTTTKTSTTGASTWTLTDREMLRGVSGATADSLVKLPSLPSASVTFTDGTSISDVTLTAVAGKSLAMRVDNRGPFMPTLAVTLNRSGKSSLSAIQGHANIAKIRPAVRSSQADSGSMISAMGTLGGSTPDSGVSFGATLTDLRGVTFKTYRNAGAATAAADTTQATTLFSGDAADLTDGTFYTLKTVPSDALGNADASVTNSAIKAGAVNTVAITCTPGSGCLTPQVDKTAPVIAWSTTNYSVTDTVVSSVSGALYNWTDTDAGTLFDSVKVQAYSNASGVFVLTCPMGNRGTASTALVSGACQTVGTPVVSSGVRRVANRVDSTANTVTAFSGLTLAANQYIITVTSVDQAGNVGNTLTRVILADAVQPTPPAVPAAVSAATGANITLSTFATDEQSVGKSTAFFVRSANALTASGATISSISDMIYEAGTLSGSTGETMGTTKLTSFLNVALAVVVPTAPAYMADGNTNALSAFSASGLNTDAKVAFGIEISDQKGNTAASATYMTPTYSDYPLWASAADGTAASAYAGVAGGVSALSGNAALTTVFVTSATANSAMAGVASSGKVTSATFTQSIKSYRYASDLESQFLGGWTSYKNGAYTCANHAANATGTVNTLVNGANSSASGSMLTALTAPTVTVWARVQRGASYIKVGDATLVSTEHSATAAGNAGATSGCDATTTRTYQFTWTPGVRTGTYPLWHETPQLMFMYQYPKGGALLGPRFGATYTAS